MPLPPDLQKAIEGQFQSGAMFKRGSFYTRGGESRGMELNFEAGRLSVWSDEITGFSGQFYDNYQDFTCRRKGFPPTSGPARKGLEGYMTDEQKTRVKAMVKYRNEQRAAHKRWREGQRGNDVEATRGTIGIIQGGGTTSFQLRWNHEPAREGSGDAVGLCAETNEFYGPAPRPCLGGEADGGAGIMLYANGEVYHKGKLLGKAAGRRVE